MISYVKREWLGRVEVWAVNTAAPYERGGEPSYPALFILAGTGTVFRCALGRTPLADKEPIGRDAAAALVPDLVRRAESGELGAPTGGDELTTTGAPMSRGGRDVDELPVPDNGRAADDTDGRR